MNISKCPVCSSTELKFFVNTKDFSLTKEEFELLQCQQCSFVFTNHIPTKEQIGPYYAFKAYVSHTNDNQGLINRLFQIVRKRTLKQKSNWVQSLFTGHKGKMLDIGAGIGAFAHSMQEKGWEVIGIEPDDATRARAKSIYNLDLKGPNALFEITDNSIDIVTMWHVLEHVHDLDDYLKAIQKITKSNSKIIIAVPNYTSFDARFYKQYWAALDVPRHLYHFSPKSMEILLARFNMQIVKTKPMWFDSFYVSMLSEQYKGSGYIGYLTAFIIGCISNLKAIFNPLKASSIIYEIKNNSIT